MSQCPHPRAGLIRSLSAQFATEIERSLQRINEAIAPYTRFVRAERQRMLDAQQDLAQISQRVESLRVQVQEL